jgi:transketolase
LTDVVEFARNIRLHSLRTIRTAGMGHIGGDFSVADILAVLYAEILRVDPTNPNDPDRDRFVMSKGHAAVSLYTTLALSNFFPVDELATFAQAESRLNGHPNRRKVPGVETNTGPLGHGLPVAVGIALGAQMRGADFHTYVVTGDGEMQEGSNWEALMYAGHRGLSNITLTIDRNHLQQGDRTASTNDLDPLDEKLAAFGWQVTTLDGHDHAALLAAYRTPATRPHAIIAHTTKGKGVSFLEDRAEWHHKVPSAEQADMAHAELSA